MRKCSTVSNGDVLVRQSHSSPYRILRTGLQDEGIKRLGVRCCKKIINNGVVSVRQPGVKGSYRYYSEFDSFSNKSTFLSI